MLGKLIVKHVIIAFVAMDRGRPFWCDRSEFERNAVLGRFPMLNAVVISTRAIVVAPSATKMSTCHAKPEV